MNVLPGSSRMRNMAMCNQKRVPAPMRVNKSQKLLKVIQWMSLTKWLGIYKENKIKEMELKVIKEWEPLMAKLSHIVLSMMRFLQRETKESRRYLWFLVSRGVEPKDIRRELMGRTSHYSSKISTWIQKEENKRCSAMHLELFYFWSHPTMIVEMPTFTWLPKKHGSSCSQLLVASSFWKKTWRTELTRCIELMKSPIEQDQECS